MPSVYVCPCSGEKRIVSSTELLSGVETELYPLCRKPIKRGGTGDWGMEIVLRCDEIGRFKRLPKNPYIPWVFGDVVIEKFIFNDKTGDCEKAPVMRADLGDIARGLERLNKVYS